MDEEKELLEVSKDGGFVADEMDSGGPGISAGGEESKDCYELASFGGVQA